MDHCSVVHLLIGSSNALMRLSRKAWETDDYRYREPCRPTTRSKQNHFSQEHAWKYRLSNKSTVTFLLNMDNYLIHEDFGLRKSDGCLNKKFIAILLPIFITVPDSCTIFVSCLLISLHVCMCDVAYWNVFTAWHDRSCRFALSSSHSFIFLVYFRCIDS